LDASNVELAFQQELAEIYRIVSSKALDQGEPSQGPGQGSAIPLGPSNMPADKKSGQCC
jgi:Ras-related protein Rab-11A